MANYGEKGWIKLWRAEMANPLYFEEPFTKWQAWIDLCMMADSEGSVRTSLKALKIRWFWGSDHKVRDFLGSVVESGKGSVSFIPNKGTLIRLNTGFLGDKKKPSKSKKESVKESVKGIEEVLPKEVGGATSSESRRTPNKINKNIYADLVGDLEDEYE